MNILPRYRQEVVEAMHHAHGVDTDYVNLIPRDCGRTSDGWGGSMWATELSDVLFPLLKPHKGVSNLGIEEDEVNIIVHGHEPTLSR